MIPILLDKTKTLAELVSSITGGIGDITGAYDGVAVEEANGLKEITFKLPISSPRYSQIIVGSYIKAKVDDLHVPQIYEVYKITKPMKGIVTVKAQHISYILGKATVMPFETTGITMVTVKMIQNLVGTFPFTFDSDIVNSTSEFKVETPISFRNAIGGWKGSILDVFGGELDWDNLDVHTGEHRGRDRGVKIEYGKNLVDLTQEESNANVYDAVIGYAIKDETTYVGDIQKITTTNSPRTLNVDFTSAFDYDETPTVAKLNQLALAYAQNNNIGIPKINLKVSFEPLAKFSEYEDIALLEQTGLFDTVNVVFPKLGVDATAKVIRTEYDFINEKPISIELGNAKTNLLGLVDEQIENQISDIDIDIDTSEIEKTIGFLDSYVDEMTDVITNSLGLFATKVEKSGGGYQMYLHNRPRLEDSQFQWTMNAGGFAISQDGGDTWSAGIDPNGNAVFNSLAANIVNALKIYGSYIYGTQVQGSQIIFGDPNDASGKYIIAQQYDADNDTNYDGVTFDGTGYVRFQPQEQFIVNNLDGNSNLLNEFVMGSSGQWSQAFVTLKNYDHVNHLLANAINMDERADSTYIANQYNKLVLDNYNTLSNDTQYLSNSVQLLASQNINRLWLYNKQYQNSTKNANTLEMYSYQGTMNRFSLSNYDLNDTNLANKFEWQTFSNVTFMAMENYQADSGGLANRLQMRGVAVASGDTTGNYVRLTNYDVDNSSNTVSTQFEMVKTRDTNSARVQVYRSGNVIGYLNINRNSSADITVTLGIPGQTINNHEYKGCYVELNSSTGRCTLYGSGGVYANGTQIG